MNKLDAVYERDRHVGRMIFTMTALFFLYFLGSLGTATKYAKFPSHYIFHWAMVVLFAILWVFVAAGRLTDLRRSRLWTFLYLLPFALMAVSLVKGSPVEQQLAIAFALAVQLPLMLLPSRSSKPFSDTAGDC